MGFPCYLFAWKQGECGNGQSFSFQTDQHLKRGLTSELHPLVLIADKRILVNIES